uniref:hypothetical protein n=1 Tax=Agathobacter sp. TaxID=2021311 RepID=UPI0040573700
MSMAIGDIASMLNQGSTTNAAQKTDTLKNSVSGLSSGSTEEELKGVLKDFESYFLEEVIKEVKETFSHEDEEESSTMSQYSDMFMDTAIEEIADILLDEIGDGMTQQLYEQMKRNYNIPSVEES